MRARSPKHPEWEKVLLAGAHLQRIVPEAVLVGGSASALHAGHRVSLDADHVVKDLTRRFDAVLAQPDSVAGWTTARVQRPVQIHGSRIRIPTRAEMLRIKAVLMLRRNATRDYLDFVALGDKLGRDVSAEALVQLCDPRRHDLEETRLGEYRRLVRRWRDWTVVRAACAKTAARLFHLLASPDPPSSPPCHRRGG